MTDCVYYHEIMTLDVLSSHPFLLFPLLGWPCSYVPDSCRVGKKCAVPLQGVKRERKGWRQVYFKKNFPLSPHNMTILGLEHLYSSLTCGFAQLSILLEFAHSRNIEFYKWNCGKSNTQLKKRVLSYCKCSLFVARVPGLYPAALQVLNFACWEIRM